MSDLLSHILIYYMSNVTLIDDDLSIYLPIFMQLCEGNYLIDNCMQ